jgi:hypothetical protein
MAMSMNGEQEENLNRVRSRIGHVIMEFARIYAGRMFHADDLREYVREHYGVAPASPDRILRDLRQRGLLNYIVINRKQSLYLFTKGEDGQGE